MTTNFSLYCDAVLDDSCSVLKSVVTMLYKGGNLRPDIYFEQNSQQQKYDLTFSEDQRHVIESSGDPYDYDIKIRVKKFDVSILSHLVEHTCNLPSSDILVKTVLKVRSSRNAVCHRQGDVSLTKSELCEKLDQLLEWYITILENLESNTNSDFISEKEQIKRKIQQKKSMAHDSPSTSTDEIPTLCESSPASESYTPQITSVKNTATITPLQSHPVKEIYTPPQSTSVKSTAKITPFQSYPANGSYIEPTPSRMSYSSRRPDFDDSPYSRSSFAAYSASPNCSTTNATQSDSGEIPTWGKVALGVTAGIAALGVARAAATRNEEQSKQKRRDQKDEECAVM